jgi:hypothetical protein
MWQRWQPSTVVYNDHDHHLYLDNAVDCTADGEEHQPHRRQLIHTSGPSAWGADGAAGRTPWHQWRSLNVGFRLFWLTVSASSSDHHRLIGGKFRADGDDAGGGH